MIAHVAYNERLFSGRGLRNYYHMARFNWACDKVSRYLGRDLRLVELGCFDGRLFDELSAFVSEYVGLDANWEGGLDEARAKFSDKSSVQFIEATDPSGFDHLPDGHFDLAASLETLEHVPPELVPGFLDQLARVTSGHLIVTVPNELGLPFLIKYTGKRLHYGGGEHYSFGEWLAALFRRSEKIERHDHKGFDYRRLLSDIAVRFDILSVDGIPPLGLPPSLAPTIGIFAKSKSREGRSAEVAANA